jgi:hypothetical protein
MKYLALLPDDLAVNESSQGPGKEPTKPAKGVSTVLLVGSPSFPRSGGSADREAQPIGVDIEALAEAVALSPRSPFENDLALARIARCAIESARTVRELNTEEVRRAAFVVALQGSREASARIVKRDYLGAYEILDALPVRLRRLSSGEGAERRDLRRELSTTQRGTTDDAE